MHRQIGGQVGRWSEKETERERKRRDLIHLSVHQWLRSAIRDSRQPTSPIGFLFLKLPPPPCAVLLVAVLKEMDWSSIQKLDEIGWLVTSIDQPFSLCGSFWYFAYTGLMNTVPCQNWCVFGKPRVLDLCHGFMGRLWLSSMGQNVSVFDPVCSIGPGPFPRFFLTTGHVVMFGIIVLGAHSQFMPFSTMSSWNSTLVTSMAQN